MNKTIKRVAATAATILAMAGTNAIYAVETPDPIVAAQNQECVMKMGPAGYWPADDGSGTVLRDLSSNKNHAQLHHVEWEGKLLYFRGLFQWAEIPASEKYQSRKISMGGWVFLRDRIRGGYNDSLDKGRGMTFLGNGYHTSSYRLDTLARDEVVFKKSTWGVNGGSPEGASICIRRGQRIDILSNGQDDIMHTAEKADLVAIGQWQHVMYTYESPAPIEGGKEWVGLQEVTHFYNGGVARLYVNGKLVKKTGKVDYKPRMAPLLVGADAQWWLQAVTSGSLDGSVRDLVIFDRALGEDEIATLFNKTRPDVNPRLFGDETLLLDERPVDLRDIAGLSSEQTWEILQQLTEFKPKNLKEFLPWLKTQKDASAVKLLLKLGEEAHVQALVPAYVKALSDQALGEEARADALLALAACKGLAKDAALPSIIAELKTLPARAPKVEDYYRNALIFALSELDPGNELLQRLIQKAEGRFFSQGDEMRDSRQGVETNYSPSAVYLGKTYRVGTGIAWHGVEAVSSQEFEDIAKEVEAKYPTVRRWAEGKELSRVYLTQTDASGKEERVYPLGRKFIFNKADAKLRGWSLAIDQDGYIHLTGGMHNAPDEENFMPGSWESWGMSRVLQDDKYPTIPYWVSTKRGDISEFEFVGHRDNPRNISLALGLNYINFAQDRNGVLYLYGRIFVQGLQSWGLYRYDAIAKRWTGIGGFAPDVKAEFPGWSDRFITMAADWLALPSIRWKNTHPKSTVLAWSRQPHFYNFIRGWGIRWDPDNRLHVQVPMFALDKNNRNKNMELYAYSDDGGATFRGVDGKILTLPLTANPGPGNACISTPQNLKRWNLWLGVLQLAGFSNLPKQ